MNGTTKMTLDQICEQEHLYRREDLPVWCEKKLLAAGVRVPVRLTGTIWAYSNDLGQVWIATTMQGWARSLSVRMLY